MKKLLSLMLVLVLSLGVASSALAASVTFDTPYYTLTLPDNWEIYESDPEKDTETLKRLGYLSSPETQHYWWVETAIHYLENWKDVSLFNADQETLQRYLDATLNDFTDVNGEFLGWFYAGDIPFVLIKCRDDDGDYIYADTMTNGYCILFYAYIKDTGSSKTYDLSDSDIALMRGIFETFQPKG